MKEGQGSEYVFPSNSAAGHLTEIKRIWSSVAKTDEIKDCRIHDLRHSFASIIASQGGSLATIGALLGHSQAQTTLRYSHLLDSTLRSAAEMVALSAGPKAKDQSDPSPVLVNMAHGEGYPPSAQSWIRISSHNPVFPQVSEINCT